MNTYTYEYILEEWIFDSQRSWSVEVVSMCRSWIGRTADRFVDQGVIVSALRSLEVAKK